MIKVQSTAEEASGLKSISQEEYLLSGSYSSGSSGFQVAPSGSSGFQVAPSGSSGFQVAPSGLKWFPSGAKWFEETFLVFSD